LLLHVLLKCRHLLRRHPGRSGHFELLSCAAGCKKVVLYTRMNLFSAISE
jgi:hypothetical protein